ncbi:hypothetical protein BDZ88DRAFT_412372 [Geranomyces variabilis]|nr:hypothetical protein BDZ88DRAFT_412372 [Geranomyces variabilis]
MPRVKRLLRCLVVPAFALCDFAPVRCCPPDVPGARGVPCSWTLLSLLPIRNRPSKTPTYTRTQNPTSSLTPPDPNTLNGTPPSDTYTSCKSKFEVA